MSDERLLEVKDLKTSFFTHLGEVQAVRGVSFHLQRGEVLGIVGESGCGKSVTALSIMKLVQEPGRITGGQILFKEQDIVTKTNREMMTVRGNEIAMIFQDPMTSLNPVYTVGNQIMEVAIKHRGMSRKEARLKAIQALELVGIPSAGERVDNYPHEFSGGMRQRAMIAMALVCRPDLLIADEPTTALDVTIQAQILRLMKVLKDRINTSNILITHDLGIVADICNRIIVMYGGIILEVGPARDIFHNPHNPYTVGLLKSVPRLDSKEKRRLVPIKGTPPDLLKPPPGCPFAARCPSAMKICLVKQPPALAVNDCHRVMCWLHHRQEQTVGKPKEARL